MIDARSQWRRPVVVATAACLLTVAGCSDSDSDPMTPAGASTSPSSSAAASPAAGPTADAGARPALLRVAAATRVVKSYAFTTSQSAGTTVTRLSGRAVRPGSLTYTLTSAGRTEQIVRINAVTYRRVPPAGFRMLVKSQAPVDPLGSLIKVLQGLKDVSRTSSPAGTTFRGVLDGPTAAAIGLVGGAIPAPGVVVPVVLTADRSARVTRFTADIPLRVAGKPVRLMLITAFTGLNKQAAIRAPRR